MTKLNFKRSEGHVQYSIKDIQAYLRKLVLESTGLQPLLEDMIRQKTESAEEEKTAEATSETSLQDLLSFTPEDAEIDTEQDQEVLDENFDDEEKPEGPTTVIRKEEN